MCLGGEKQTSPKSPQVHTSVLCLFRVTVEICLWVSVWGPLSLCETGAFRAQVNDSLTYSSAAGTHHRKGRLGGGRVEATELVTQEGGHTLLVLRSHSYTSRA